MLANRLEKSAQSPGAVVIALYLACVAALTARIATLDGWDAARYVVLALFLTTFPADRIAAPTLRSLIAGLSFFAGLSFAVTYLPDLWFSIAYQLHHAKNYLWHANDFMRSLPGNDARFLWGHQLHPLSEWMAWIYENGFDMVVWIPMLRSLVACDAFKTAHYALAAHIIQFPMIMPFFATTRVDEVWSVLGHPDLLQRGWSDETRLDLGANCFPSMHTSVAFAILLLALREKSKPYRVMMVLYATSIIISTMYMEVHWVVDVLAGLLLGWAAVILSDNVLAKTHAAIHARLPARDAGLAQALPQVEP